MQILGNRVLLEITESEITAKQSTIHVPASIKSKPSEGIVKLIGNGNKIPSELMVGMRVKVNPNMGSQACNFHGVACRIFSVEDIELILEYAV